MRGFKISWKPSFLEKKTRGTDDTHDTASKQRSQRAQTSQRQQRAQTSQQQRAQTSKQQKNDKPDWIVKFKTELSRLKIEHQKGGPRRVLVIPHQLENAYMVIPSKTTSVREATRLIEELKPTNKWLQNYKGDIVAWSSKEKGLYSVLTWNHFDNISDAAQQLLQNIAQKQQHDSDNSRPDWIVPFKTVIKQLNNGLPLKREQTIPPEINKLFMVLPSKTTSVSEATRLIKELKPTNKWLQNYKGDIVAWSSRKKDVYSALTWNKVIIPHEANRLLEGAIQKKAQQRTG